MDWFHVSHTWDAKKMLVEPRMGRIDDPSSTFDKRPFIAVCPTVAKCLIGIGDWYSYERYYVYRAITQSEPQPTDWVFDVGVTDEHRFYDTVSFERVGELDAKTLELKVGYIPATSRNIEKLLKNLMKMHERLVEALPSCMTLSHS